MLYHKVAVKAAEPQVLTVTGVAAADATTLTVTGTKLGDLTAADIKVTPTVAVASYTAAEDGKTATVKLSAGLQSGTEYTVTVNGTDFKVKYTVGEITSVAVTETAYDDDTPGQQIAMTVNGGSPITVNDLLADGYFVEFSVTSKGAADNGFFATGTNKSTTGIISSSAIKGDDYQVQVVLTKGSSIITSPLATVKVVNLDVDATGVESFVLSGKTGANGSQSIVGVKLTGKTLVAGETVVLTEASIATAYGKVKLPSSVVTKVAITSDNPNVIQAGLSADKADMEVKAIAPGTATLTFTYGSAKTTASYTVVSDNRHPNSATAEPSTVRVIKGGTATTEVIVKDQYGEFVQGLSLVDDARIYDSSAENIATVAGTTTKTNDKGKAVVTATGIDAGTAYLMVSYNDPNANKTAYTAATIVVTTASTADSTKNKLVVKSAAGFSDDLKIDTYTSGDTQVKIKYNSYTINDALVTDGAVMTDYYFQYNAAVISLDAISSTEWEQVTKAGIGYNCAEAKSGQNPTEITFAAKSAGTTTLTLYNKAKQKVAETTITVTDSTPYLTGVTFNSACPTSLLYVGEELHYTDVFNIKGSAGDPIINGITVAQPCAQLRIVKATGATMGDIYIDADNDSAFTAGVDTVIGKITVTGDTTYETNFMDSASGVYKLQASGSEKTITFTVTDKYTKKVIAAKAIKVAY